MNKSPCCRAVVTCSRISCCTVAPACFSFRFDSSLAARQRPRSLQPQALVTDSFSSRAMSSRTATMTASRPVSQPAAGAGAAPLSHSLSPQPWHHGGLHMSCQLINELTSLLTITHFPPGGVGEARGEILMGERWEAGKKMAGLFLAQL